MHSSRRFSCFEPPSNKKVPDVAADSLGNSLEQLGGISRNLYQHPCQQQRLKPTLYLLQGLLYCGSLFKSLLTTENSETTQLCCFYVRES